MIARPLGRDLERPELHRSAGAVAVAQGAVIEDRLLLGRPPAEAAA